MFRLELIALVVLLLFVVVMIWYDRRLSPRRRGTQQPAYEAAVAAIDKMKEWGIWMAGISTAAIGGVGALLPRDHLTSTAQRTAAILAVLFFGASILVTTWLLAALPSLHLRLRPGESPENDIYEQRILWLVVVRVGLLATFQHLFFALAVIFFTYFIYQSLPPSVA